MTDTKDRLREAMREAFKEAIKGVAEEAFCSDEVWDGVDKMIQEDFDQSVCSIDFEEGVPCIFVGVGAGNAAHSFSEFQIATELYGGVLRSPEQREGVKDQIKGINKLAKQLAKAKKELEEVLHDQPAGS